MIFNPKESINFEGDTGPYLLYTYARASSIINKIKSSKISIKLKKENAVAELEQKEIDLVKKLSQFKEIVLKSYQTAENQQHLYQL